MEAFKEGIELAVNGLLQVPADIRVHVLCSVAVGD